MSMFKCDKCNAVDVFEIAYKEHIDGTPLSSLECTECQTGKWHGFFPKENYDSKKNIIIINDDEEVSPSM